MGLLPSTKVLGYYQEIEFRLFAMPSLFILLGLRHSAEVPLRWMDEMDGMDAGS